MRLICPNCGAQYEVDGDVIPETGRDVQCSNCGHTWFQKHASGAVEGADETVTAPPAQTPAEAKPVQDHAETEGPPSELPKTAAAQRQAMDPEVADVLRQEAELETSQRQSTPEPIVNPPEQAVEQAVEKAIADSDTLFEEQSVQLHSENEELQNTRRDLLPDIEEINSTLAATGDTAASEQTSAVTEQNRRINFRRGFLAAMVAFAVMALVYVFAPGIVDAIPQSTSMLSSYVEWVNGLRLALDNSMLGAVEKLTGLLSQLNSDKAS